MRKTLLLLLFCSMVGRVSLGQESLTTISLDLIQNKVNGGKPLPSEEKFYIRGAIPEQIEMVKVSIYPSKKSDKSGKTYFWTPPFGYKKLDFQLFVEDELRSNEDYHMDFGFYQKAGVNEVKELRDLIATNISTYLNTITIVKKGGIQFEDSDEQVLSNMGIIVERGAYYFETPNGVQFPGFSDLTRNKLEQRKKLKMGKAKYNATGVAEGDNARAVYARQYLDELLAIATAEIDQFLTTNMLVRVGEKSFQNYPSEKKPNSILINAGYGAISLSKNLPQQEFVHSPYVGLSFPLGNRTFARFMSNVSLSTGAFISGNIENSRGERITGPLLDRPVYVGLGYNFFRFFRLNAGGTFLTTERLDGSQSQSFHPFVGISAEFRIWLGLGNKR
ncbi:hypothetical protein [Algoriphagus confluentis]|uniref:Uncharacterized protein n=1 Tax=Algoriphagus confluentis TaxID=1697556 RepID=A0ABQ6PPP5_9BACT|nr:hypothetical protein Aconfl_25490 [Algoriphagus confluentis]